MSDRYQFSQVFAAACLSLLFFGVGVISLGTVLPDLIGKYGLSEIEAGALTALLPAGILGGSLVFGPVVDRYSYRSLLIVCLLLIFLGLEGVAFAPGYVVVQLGFFLIGFGGGAINGGASALVADISADRPGSRGANLSLAGVFFGVGALGMPVAMGFFTRFYSYEPIVAAIGMLVGLSCLFLVRTIFPAPKHAQGFPLKEGLGLLREVPLLLLGFVLFFQSGIEGLINAWTTTFLQGALEVAPARALFILSLSVGGLTAGRLVLAGLLRRIRPYRVLGLSLAFVLAGGILLAAVPQPAAATAALILIGLGLAAGFPVMLGYVGDLYARLSGTAFSLAFTIALLGNITINFLMGVIAQEWDIARFSWLFLGCLIAQMILLVVTLSRIRKQIEI